MHLYYTLLHPHVVEVTCVLFLDYACWPDKKQNTWNFYHKQMKDGVRYEACFLLNRIGAISGLFEIKYICYWQKALYLLYLMRYGSPDCYEKCLNDRSNNQASLVDPGEYQNMMIKYLSVGLQTWFSYQQVALNLLFQIRYDSLPNSHKHLSDMQKALGTPIFTIKQELFCKLLCTVSTSRVCKHPSSF